MVEKANREVGYYTDLPAAYRQATGKETHQSKALGFLCWFLYL